MGLLRGREKMIYWYMPLFLPYFLSSFYHFLSFTLFLFYFYFLTTLLSWVVPYLALSFLRSFSLGDSLFLSASPHPISPLSAMVASSFYSELIQWDFSLLPLGLHQLFLVCCGHPFKITYSPIGCPCHCSVHVYCIATHFMTKFPFVCSCCIHLPHYLALWHASDGPNHLLLLLGNIPS